FSRTHVGVTRYGYLEVMAALRAGRVWVDHGQLVDGIDVRLAPVGSRQRGVTLGGRLRVHRSQRLELRVTVTSATRPNYHGLLPQLAHVDVIRGVVTGPVAAKDSWKAPDTRVVEQVDVRHRKGTYELRIPLGSAERSHYVRVRGSDGRRNGTGYLGSRIDPAGPIQHPNNDGDPWLDTWLYTNPIFVDVAQ
ncbi:histidinol-phosphatase, partial [Streptomyces sp. NPDC058122]